MLKLKPSCEHCNKSLPPNAVNAMICSYECTFCKECVDDVFETVCPKCGGNFAPRPIRPSNNWKDGNYLGNDPASTVEVFSPKDVDAHAALVEKVKDIPPHER